MAARLRPYVMSNFDGHNAALVVAGSLREAADKMRVSVYAMRQMGWHRGDSDDAFAAFSAPNAVFYRPIDNVMRYAWSRTRYERDYEAGSVAYRLMTTRNAQTAVATDATPPRTP